MMKFKNFLSNGLITIKISTKHLWVVGTHIRTNDGPHPFSRGENFKKVKILCQNLKIFFYKTTGPNSIKLGTKHPRVVGNQVCENEGPLCYARGVNYEIA